MVRLYDIIVIIYILLLLNISFRLYNIIYTNAYGKNLIIIKTKIIKLLFVYIWIGINV